MSENKKNTRKCNSLNLSKPSFNKVQYQMFFTNRVINLWNSLPEMEIEIEILFIFTFVGFLPIQTMSYINTFRKYKVVEHDSIVNIHYNCYDNTNINIK